jgi:hypothetical protein
MVSGKRKTVSGKWKAVSGKRKAESGKRKTESGKQPLRAIHHSLLIAHCSPLTAYRLPLTQGQPMTGKVNRIDVHSHVLPRELIELIRRNPRDYQMCVEGTDAPFDMADDDPLAMIDAVPGLSAEQRDRIFGLNALELLGEAAAFQT